MYFSFSKVDEQGKFHSQGDDRLLYGTMLQARIYLCENFTIALARSITIAMRYSAVRFQGQNLNGYILFYLLNDLISILFIYRNPTRIIDYPLQQDKLVPCLSSTYAFIIAFLKLNNYFNQLNTNQKIYLERLSEVNNNLSFSFKLSNIYNTSLF